MRVSSVVVDGKVCYYGAVDIHRRDSTRMAELYKQGFWAAVESGNTIVMLKSLREKPMMFLETYATFELVIMLERAHTNEQWGRYDQIFEELRERGTFA